MAAISAHRPVSGTRCWWKMLWKGEYGRYEVSKSECRNINKGLKHLRGFLASPAETWKCVRGQRAYNNGKVIAPEQSWQRKGRCPVGRLPSMVQSRGGPITRSAMVTEVHRAAAPAAGDPHVAFGQLLSKSVHDGYDHTRNLAEMLFGNVDLLLLLATATRNTKRKSKSFDTI